MKVLFLCTGNSCRSQMAEGLLRRLGGEIVEAASAGTHPKPVHPDAVRIMQEIAVDISGQKSKSVKSVLKEPFDYVITLCDSAKESCPVFPGKAQHLHWDVPDPAAAKGTKAQRLKAFRAVRDQLATRLDELLADVLDSLLERLSQDMDAYEAGAPPAP